MRVWGVRERVDGDMRDAGNTKNPVGEPEALRATL